MQQYSQYRKKNLTPRRASNSFFSDYQKKSKPRPKSAFAETDLQIKIARYISQEYSDVIFISSGNGIKKNKAQAGIWRAINSEKGQPDMILLHPSRGYHGLCLEIKKDGEKVYKKDGSLRRQMVKVKNKYGIVVGEYNHLQKQHDCLLALNNRGYFARFVIGYDKAIQAIDWYMQRPVTKQLF